MSLDTIKYKHQFGNCTRSAQHTDDWIGKMGIELDQNLKKLLIFQENANFVFDNREYVKSKEYEKKLLDYMLYGL